MSRYYLVCNELIFSATKSLSSTTYSMVVSRNRENETFLHAGKGM
jgi:hypothetical protein